MKELLSDHFPVRSDAVSQGEEELSQMESYREISTCSSILLKLRPWLVISFLFCASQTKLAGRARHSKSVVKVVEEVAVVGAFRESTEILRFEQCVHSRCPRVQA